MNKKVEIVGVVYPSFYVKEFDTAVAFYTNVFGVPQVNQERIKGWYLGNTWLTLFPSADGGVFPDSNPRNGEFAVQVGSPEQVDILFNAMVDAGAKPFWEPKDGEMYEKMRFSCVDDPVGIRVDIICPLPIEEQQKD